MKAQTKQKLNQYEDNFDDITYTSYLQELINKY